MSIRVLIVDDNELTRTGFRLMLNAEPDITVIGEAPDGADAITASIALRPDVILMDVRMPRLDGIEATRRVTAQRPAPRVLILTTFDLDEYAFDGLAAGASGFLLKDVTPEQLGTAVRSVHEGDAVVTPRITRRMLEAAQWPNEPATTDKEAFDSLTPREREIATAITEGLTNAEIAARFTLSAGTVKTYVNRLLRKLNARDRIEIVIRGHRAGLSQSSPSAKPGTSWRY